MKCVVSNTDLRRTARVQNLLKKLPNGRMEEAENPIWVIVTLHRAAERQKSFKTKKVLHLDKFQPGLFEESVELSRASVEVSRKSVQGQYRV